MTTRRHKGFALAFACAFAFTLASSNANAQVPAGLDTIRVVTTPVAPGVYMLTGQGGNITVAAGEDGKFMVDDEYAALVPRIDSALAAIGPQPLRFLINTHWHYDHIGGNEHYARAGVTIIAQDNVRRRMSTDQVMEAFKLAVPASPQAALPVITFADSLTIHFDGDEIIAMHVPHAHTDGDAVIHFAKANVMVMGDTYFSNRYPLIALSAGGSIDGLIAAMDRVLAMTNDSTRYIAGHGPITGRDALVRYRAMLVGIRTRVHDLRARGKTLAEAQAAHPTAAYDATWGNGRIKPDDFARLVYMSLAARNK